MDSPVQLKETNEIVYIKKIDIREEFENEHDAMIIYRAFSPDNPRLKGSRVTYRVEGNCLICLCEGISENCVVMSKDRFYTKLELAKQIFREFPDYKNYL
ncbi:hypothetical protein MXB_2887, partial [Myxobolus squamalis]